MTQRFGEKMTPLARALTIVVTVIGLSACSSVRETLSGENSIDYKSAQRVDPLSIPPDLTQAAADPRYRAPASGSTTLSEFQSLNQGTAATSQAALTQVAVLPSYPGIEVKRDGNLRWLVVNQPPEVLFPKVEEFWYESGFNLDVIDPKAGIMIRSAIGALARLAIRPNTAVRLKCCMENGPVAMPATRLAAQAAISQLANL